MCLSAVTGIDIVVSKVEVTLVGEKSSTATVAESYSN
jgi:hypothetical protein